MRLSDLPGLLLEDILGKWRRRIIAGGVIVICAIGAVIEGFSAGRHALEQSVGPVGARLIIAGIFLVALGATIVWLRMAEKQKSETAASAKGEQRTALIAEALSLGYTLAEELTRRRAPSSTDESADGPRQRNGAAADERSAA